MKNLLLAAAALLLISCQEYHTYAVRIFYCDNRRPEVIVVGSVWYPGRRHIENYKNAVPEYYGRLNVCDVEVLNMVK